MQETSEFIVFDQEVDNGISTEARVAQSCDQVYRGVKTICTTLSIFVQLLPDPKPKEYTKQTKMTWWIMIINWMVLGNLKSTKLIPNAGFVK